MSMNDGGHRPHGTHFGESPQFKITTGPESLNVTLDTWGPQYNVFPALYDMLQANWGDHPSRTVARETMRTPGDDYGISMLTMPEWRALEAALKGHTLSQALEMLTFTFTVDGVTRAFTHEFVRTRIGAGFMQHGGRDNDWRHRDWTMPETIWRACQRPEELEATGLVGAVTEWKPIHKLLLDATEDGSAVPGLVDLIQDHLRKGRLIYAALVDAGIPWQDARRLIPIGTQTYIHGTYNYVALKGVLANRLEFIMDWEINCVVQLMLREIKLKCPAILSQYLGSHSDLLQRPAFAGLDSWPPDGKYPYRPVCVCGHAYANHFGIADSCEVCLRDRMAHGNGTPMCAGYTPVDERRTHRAEQMPFFVLTKTAMNGGPVQWIKTNGTFPHEEYERS